ncbi:GNAT family N-acetyltransferase [Lolliginicoccus suaedae]|uniref:GNAT family N-acetyltransferase n=1 Tax=Lolliginicoccus suaedae TaxID=2605429 RepID=UPI0011EE673C|nr:GNAT family protein [Lolliginicoccus suaedae]
MIPPFVPVADPRPTDTPWPTMQWPIPAGTTLAGTTVSLSPLDPDTDSEALFACLDHDQVWAFVPVQRPRSATDLHALFSARRTLSNWQQWTVRLAREYKGLAPGTIVGTTSYTNVSPADARLEIGGTFYTPQIWGSIVNPECKLLLMRLAFEALNVGRAEIRTDTRNTRSQLAITRLGAVYEGTQRRYARRPDGTVRDTVLFSIIAEEWATVEHNLTERITRAIAKESLGQDHGGASAGAGKPHPCLGGFLPDGRGSEMPARCPAG